MPRREFCACTKCCQSPVRTPWEHGGTSWVVIRNAMVVMGAPWHPHVMENVKLFAIFSSIFVRSHGALRNFKSPCQRRVIAVECDRGFTLVHVMRAIARKTGSWTSDHSTTITNKDEHWVVMYNTLDTSNTYPNTWMYNWKASYTLILSFFKLYVKLAYSTSLWKLSDWKFNTTQPPSPLPTPILSLFHNFRYYCYHYYHHYHHQIYYYFYHHHHQHHRHHHHYYYYYHYYY